MAKITKKKGVQESFSRKFEALEKIVADFEDKDLSLDDSLKKFESGLKLAQELKVTLTTVENTIESLKNKYQIDQE